LPTSDPTEFSVGSSRGGKPSNFPTEAWNAPNMAFVEVLLPESATPIQPRMGATMTNQGPILENPNASDPAGRRRHKETTRMEASSSSMVWRTGAFASGACESRLKLERLARINSISSVFAVYEGYRI